MLIRTDNILEAVEAMPDFRNASTVLAYWSIGDEVPTHDFIAKWHGSKRIALPVVLNHTDMEFRLYDPDRMVRGACNIYEPSKDCPLVKPEEIEFAIIPGERFDVKGNRKGHGNGYYDRALPHIRCKKVGIAPSSKIVNHLNPEPWDCPVDVVVSGL